MPPIGGADPVLAGLADPMRDRAVARILEAIAEAIGTGGDVTAEPEQRDAEGRVARSGKLSLPRRSDFSIARGGRRLVRRVESGPVPAEASVAVATENGFVAEISPFPWDAAVLRVYTSHEQPNCAPLRRWFLEWFQSRHSEVAPDLTGALHSLDGPVRKGRAWEFRIDFGSAPVACLSDLIGALVEGGAARMWLGQD